MTDKVTVANLPPRRRIGVLPGEPDDRSTGHVHLSRRTPTARSPRAPGTSTATASTTTAPARRPPPRSRRRHYTVGLRVTDDPAAPTRRSKTVTVHRAASRRSATSPPGPVTGERSASSRARAIATARSLAAWDLNGDGPYDDGTGEAVTKTFAEPGDYTGRVARARRLRRHARDHQVHRRVERPVRQRRTGCEFRRRYGGSSQRPLAPAEGDRAGVLLHRSSLTQDQDPLAPSPWAPDNPGLSRAMPCRCGAACCEHRGRAGAEGRPQADAPALRPCRRRGRTTLALKPRRRDRKWLSRARGLRVALQATVIAVGGGTPVEVVRRATVKR